MQYHPTHADVMACGSMDGNIAIINPRTGQTSLSIANRFASHSINRSISCRICAFVVLSLKLSNNLLITNTFDERQFQFDVFKKKKGGGRKKTDEVQQQTK
jgi:hypothetical protein